MKHTTTQFRFLSISLLFIGLFSMTGLRAGCTTPPNPTPLPPIMLSCKGAGLCGAGAGSATALIFQYDDNPGFISPTQVAQAWSNLMTSVSTMAVSAPGATIYWRIRAVDCTGTCTCFSAWVNCPPIVIPNCPATSDNCAGAIAMPFQTTGSGAWTCSTTTGATASADANPPCWAGNTLEDVWYKVTISGTNLLVTTDQSNTTAIDSQVAIYSSCGGALLGCSMDAYLNYNNGYSETSTGASALATGLSSGTTYYIRLDGDGINDGFFCLKATGVAANDCYNNATTLVNGITVNGTTYGATEDCDGVGGTTDCDLGGANSVIDCGPGGGASVENNVWYLIPCTISGTYVVSLTNVACNGSNGLQLWGGINQVSCTAFNAQANDGGSGEFCNNTAAVAPVMTSTFNCVAGQTARFMVDGFAAEMCSFGISFNNFTVPIILTSFTGVYADGKTNLNWVTASEINNDYFEIEKSTDGRIFYPIGKVEAFGDGNSSQTYIYNFVDFPAENETSAYYRLHQVDKNGAESFSDIIYVVMNTSANLELMPNPVYDQTSLRFTVLDYGLVELSVTDLDGRLVQRDQFISFSGLQEYALDLQHVPSGMYVVRLITGTQNLQKRLIKN